MALACETLTYPEHERHAFIAELLPEREREKFRANFVYRYNGARREKRAA